MDDFDYDCWNCGRPGIDVAWSAIIKSCPACDVWWSFVRDHALSPVTQVMFKGDVFPAVDFTMPYAPSSPA